MASLNRIILIGTVATEPDVKVTTSGDSVANFTLSVDRPARTDGFESRADQIKVVAWRQLADQCGNFSSGQMLLVEGRVHTRSYDDQSGNRHYVTEVEAKEFREVGQTSSSDSFAPPSIDPVQMQESPVIEEMDQDITPFQFDDVKNNDLSSPPVMEQDGEEDIPF